MGYEIEFAEEGAEAIEQYKKAKETQQVFDVVILDLTVRGGMGGKEAIRKLVEIDPGVKAIVTSGYSDDPIMFEFERYGFKGALAKPYKIEKLIETVSRVMGKVS
jgi:DNA-binding NtrC family response regulator